MYLFRTVFFLCSLFSRPFAMFSVGFFHHFCSVFLAFWHEKNRRSRNQSERQTAKCYARKSGDFMYYLVSVCAKCECECMCFMNGKSDDILKQLNHNEQDRCDSLLCALVKPFCFLSLLCMLTAARCSRVMIQRCARLF